MVRNYIKIAWRNIVKNKFSSIINIGGLSLGMAVAMLIALWIYDEVSYNQYHQKYNSIVQILKKQKFLGETKVWSSVPYLLINELKINYQNDFKQVVPAISADGYTLAAGEKQLPEKGEFLDAAGPEMFTLKMLKGRRNGLQDPFTVILSASAAKALFGDADPMYQTLTLKNNWVSAQKVDVKVTGVYEDLPHNTELNDIKFFSPIDLFVSMHHNTQRWMKWDDNRFLLYAEIQPNANLKIVSANIKEAELKVIRHLDNFRAEQSSNPEILLNPMRNWHLYSNFKDGIADHGPIQFVWFVGIIGMFVLILACINFMNLNTARSEKRSKEVGIRKAIGSSRGYLIFQFFGESFLTVLMAFFFAFLVVILALPAFNDLTGKQMTIPFLNPFFWLFSFGFVLMTSLLAGSYPALYLSSFKPVKVLKGSFIVGRFAAVPRKILVVLQFTVSVTLITSTIIVYKQLVFTKNRPVGYTRDGLLMVPVNSVDFKGKFDLLRSALKSNGAIEEMAQSESPVTGLSSHNGGFEWKNNTRRSEQDFGTLQVSQEYGKTVGWQLASGRDFLKGNAADSSGFVINEAAAKYMGLRNPTGELVRWKNTAMQIDKSFKIIGVIKDMVMQSPYEPVKPTIFRLGANPNWIYIRINRHMSASSALSRIEGVYKNFIRSVPFEYKFAGDEYNKKFATEERIGKLAGLFAILAIFISSIGLFGMAAFLAEQRIKEIGIRKLLGASVFSLWYSQSVDFIKLVTIALLIATPIAWYFMHNWLENYEYRIQLSWWIFAATGFIAIIITLLTVSYESFKAAITNPVKALRSE